MRTVVEKVSPKAAAFRLKMTATAISPPTAEDWMVTVWFKGFDGKDHKKTIRIGDMRRHGTPIEITEEQAVQQALASLRRYIVNNKRAGWDEIPRAYDVRAVPRHKIGAQKIETKLDDLIRQFMEM